MNAKREARRKRDREDFVRATTQGMKAAGHKPAPAGTSAPGACAGNTYREHLEDKLEATAGAHRRAKADNNEEKVQLYRGIIRGLAMALALYENSYDYSIERVKKIEKGFL